MKPSKEFSFPYNKKGAEQKRKKAPKEETKEESKEEEIIINPNLECSVCNDILFHPVSTPCGHTFCRECLIVTLRIKPQCPNCRTPCFMQESNLKENVTIKTIVENMYSEYTKKKEQKLEAERKQKEAAQRGARGRNRVSVNRPFTPMIIIPLNKALMHAIFPGASPLIHLRLKCEPQVVQNILNESKFLAIPDSVVQDGTLYKTCVFEIVNIKKVSGPDLYRARVKACERVCVDKYTELDVTRQMLDGWGFGEETQPLTFKVGNGYYLDDKNIATEDQIKEQVVHIETFLNKKLGEWVNSSPTSAQVILSQLKPILTESLNRNMDYFVNFSLQVTRALKIPRREKKKLFESTNTYQRLASLKKIIDEYPPNADYTDIFDVTLPGKELGNTKTAILILIGVILSLLYLGKGKFF